MKNILIIDGDKGVTVVDLDRVSWFNILGNNMTLHMENGEQINIEADKTLPVFEQYYPSLKQIRAKLK